MRQKFNQMTPKQAFLKYMVVDCGEGIDPIGVFFSDFILEGYTSLQEMCEQYAKEVVDDDEFVTEEEILHVAFLLEKYIREYIEQKGGTANIPIYTEEELDELFEIESVEMLKAYYRLVKKIYDSKKEKEC